MIKRMEWYSRKHFVILYSMLVLLIVLIVTQSLYFQNLDQYFKKGLLEWSREIVHLKYAIISLALLACAIVPTIYVVFAFFKNGRAFSKRTLIVVFIVLAILIASFAASIGDQHFWKDETQKILSGQYATGSDPSFLSSGRLNQYVENLRIGFLQSIADIYIVNIVFVTLSIIGTTVGSLLLIPYWSEI